MQESNNSLKNQPTPQEKLTDIVTTQKDTHRSHASTQRRHPLPAQIESPQDVAMCDSLSTILAEQTHRSNNLNSHRFGLEELVPVVQESKEFKSTTLKPILSPPEQLHSGTQGTVVSYNEQKSNQCWNMQSNQNGFLNESSGKIKQERTTEQRIYRFLKESIQELQNTPQISNKKPDFSIDILQSFEEESPFFHQINLNSWYQKMNALHTVSPQKMGEKFLSTVASAKSGTIITLPCMRMVLQKPLHIQKDLQLNGGPGCILAFPEEITDFTNHSMAVRIERESNNIHKIRFSANQVGFHLFKRNSLEGLEVVRQMYPGPKKTKKLFLKSQSHQRIIETSSQATKSEDELFAQEMKELEGARKDLESKMTLKRTDYATKVILLGVLSGNVDIDFKDCYLRIVQANAVISLEMKEYEREKHPLELDFGFKKSTQGVLPLSPTLKVESPDLLRKPFSRFSSNTLMVPELKHAISNSRYDLDQSSIIPLAHLNQAFHTSQLVQMNSLPPRALGDFDKEREDFWMVVKNFAYRKQIQQEDEKQPEYYAMLVDSWNGQRVKVNFKSTHFFGPFTSHFVSISDCDTTMSSCSVLQARQCGIIVRNASHFHFIDGQVRQNLSNGFFFPFFSKNIQLQDLETMEQKYKSYFRCNSELKSLLKTLISKIEQNQKLEEKTSITIQKSAVVQNGANGIYSDYFSVSSHKMSSKSGTLPKVFSGKFFLENNRIQRNSKSGIAIRGVGTAQEVKEMSLRRSHSLHTNETSCALQIELEIINCDLGLNDSMGLWLVGLQHLSLVNSKVHRTSNNGFGVYIRNIEECILKDCKIYRNEGGGISFIFQKNIIDQNCTLSLNQQLKNYSDTQKMPQNTYARQYTSLIRKTEEPKWAQQSKTEIQLPYYCTAQIYNCEIYENAMNGIQSHNWSGLIYISNSTIQNNVLDGLMLNMKPQELVKFKKCSSRGVAIVEKNLLLDGQEDGSQHEMAEKISGFDQSRFLHQPEKIIKMPILPRKRSRTIVQRKTTKIGQKLLLPMMCQFGVSEQASIRSIAIKTKVQRGLEVSEVLDLLRDAWPQFFVKFQLMQLNRYTLEQMIESQNGEDTPLHVHDQQSDHILKLLSPQKRENHSLQRYMPRVNFKSIWIEGKTLVLLRQVCINSNERNGVYVGGTDVYLATQDVCISKNIRNAVWIQKEKIISNKLIKFFTQPEQIVICKNQRCNDEETEIVAKNKIRGKIGGSWGRVDIGGIERKKSFNVPIKRKEKCCMPTQAKVGVSDPDKQQQSRGGCVATRCLIF